MEKLNSLQVSRVSQVTPLNYTHVNWVRIAVKPVKPVKKIMHINFKFTDYMNKKRPKNKNENSQYY
jgi:hypothetical protein